MVKHQIIWKLKSELSENEKNEIKKNAKEALEALVGKIDGLTNLKIHTDMLETATADMMLESVFVSNEAYIAYRTHPDHVAAADKYVRPFVAERACCDYEE